jgi:hypothetical protein
VECTATRVVKVDEVDEAAIDRHMRLFKAHDVVCPG